MHWREKSQTKPEKGNGFAGGGHRQLLSPCACYAGIFCICYLQMSVSVRNYTTPPHYAPPPLLLSIPDCLRRWPCSLLARRRRRRRGRRGGLAIKLKVFLRLHREPQLQLGFHAECLAGKRFIRWRSLEPVHGWIISVFPTSAAPLPVIRSPRWSVHGPSLFTTLGKFVYGLFGIHASA